MFGIGIVKVSTDTDDREYFCSIALLADGPWINLEAVLQTTVSSGHDKSRHIKTISSIKEEEEFGVYAVKSL